MKHVLAFLILLGALLFVTIRVVSPEPYVYDEADYMYAASLGFAANYTDTPTLSIIDFVRAGLNAGRVPSQRQALSELIRSGDDVVFYRHWHGPLYLYALIPISRLGFSEKSVRSAMLVIPALTLTAIYFGCLWTVPGVAGFFAAIFGGLLFISSGAVTGSTELAPHHLFALISICFLFLSINFLNTGRRICWYGAVAGAALAFCTLEIAFVLILTLAVVGYRERRRIEKAKSLALFLATVFIVWPAAIYKLSFVKGYLFMAYLALFRSSPWGNEGFFETWRFRIVDSPLEWVAILAGLIVYFRSPARSEKRREYPILVYAALMLAATARILTRTARYSLLFMPPLDIFAALTPPPATRRARYVATTLLAALAGLTQYSQLTRDRNRNPVPPEILKYIRQNGFEDKALLVPQGDLPMIHYYFPGTHLRGYYGAQPAASDLAGFASNGVLYPGSPVRIERPVQ